MNMKFSSGRAGTVLVFDVGGDTKAVTSAVVAHTKNDISERIRIAGPVDFKKLTIAHIKDVIMPIIDNISDMLDITKKNFEISIVNPGASAIFDMGINIGGFSADVPVFLAMLSAALGMTTADSIVSTGHIASTDGDIAAVKEMDLKLSAAVDNEAIEQFIYPDLKTDQSLKQLVPKQREKAEISIINAKGNIGLSVVSDIADLIRIAFTDKAIVTASLRQGFFNTDGMKTNDGSAIKKAVNFLSGDNEKRFWDILEQDFLDGNIQDVKRLLTARLDYHLRCGTYPHQFGQKLLQLLRCLPPAIKKLKIDFPLLETVDWVKLGQFAAKSDGNDIRALHDAAEGRNIFIEDFDHSPPKAEQPIDVNDEKAVDMVISQISAKGIAKAVGIPIDTARATYVLNSLMVKSDHEFYEAIAAFYLHLKRHVNLSPQLIDDGTTSADAMALVERAFADKGGLKAAMTEAREAIHGGMKLILDVMTEQFRTEKQSNYVNNVIKRALSPLDVNAQRSFISVLLRRLAPHLSPEIVSSPPERFIEHYEDIVKEYVRSLDKINEVFGRF